MTDHHAIPLTAHVTVPDGVLIREIGGESVLLNLNTEQYYGLDDTGTRMWQAVTGADTVAAARDDLLTLYEVDADTLTADLLALLADLEDRGLVVIHR